MSFVKGYTDASFQTDKDDSKSQSGFVFCLNGGAVSWKSSKQETVVDSMIEAEYIAASEAAKEAIWIRKIVSDLGVVPSASSPVDLYCDNSGAVALANEPRTTKKSRHIGHVWLSSKKLQILKNSSTPNFSSQTPQLHELLIRKKYESSSQLHQFQGAPQGVLYKL